MVRRALSLRRGSTLELEIETGRQSTRSVSFDSGDVDIGAASDITRRGSRRDSSNSAISSLPLSRHHQSMRRRSSVAVTGTGAMETIMKSRNRNRTDSSSTSASTSSRDSIHSSQGNGSSAVSELGETVNMDMNTESIVVPGTVAVGNSSMLDNELAVILDDDDDSRNTANGQV